MSMTVSDYLTRIQSDAAAALALLPPDPEPPPIDWVVVENGGDLQAALDHGGAIRLAAGATFTGHFVVTSHTTIDGADAALHGPAGGPPTLYVPPRTSDVSIHVGDVTNDGDQAVIQIGTSDATQTTIADCPARVAITARVPHFAGKRAYYVNGTDVTLDNCQCYETWDPAGRDSQGVLIFNTPGPVTIRGGVYEAGSENIMVGGDVTAIPDVQPADIIVEDVTLSRPLSWKTDGTKRKVKCLFELKAGVRVVLRRARLSGCWTDAQTGWAIMLTPRNGKAVQDVLLEDVTVRDTGGFCSILGYDNGEYSPQLRDLAVRRADAICLGGDYGAGRFMQWEGSPANISVEKSLFSGPGTTFYVGEGTTWIDPTHPATGGITYGVEIRDNEMTLMDYAIMLLGQAYARDWISAWPDGEIDGNAFTAPAANVQGLTANLPSTNTITASRRHRDR
jgi:hypothetical protein